MRVGFPVVAAATAVAAVLVLAQAVQGVDGPDEPRIGPTIVLPVKSGAEAGAETDTAPARPQRPVTEPDRTPTPDRPPVRRPGPAGPAASTDPAAPRPAIPRPTVTPFPSPAAPPPDLGTDPGADSSERIPVPVCRVEQESPPESWRDRRHRRDDGDRNGWDRDERYDSGRGGYDAEGRPFGQDDDADQNRTGCRD